jgi:hypothetical protein
MLFVAGSQTEHGDQPGAFRGRYLALIGLFVLLTILATCPLVAHLGSRILGAPAPGDNFEYLYKTWWFKHALFDLGVSPLFNPNMFYPFGYQMVFSETTIANTIPALPLTVLFGEVVAFNLTLATSFVLSGLSMYLLVLYLTGDRLAGVLSGAIFAFCPYRMAHLGAGHLPLMGTQWLPLMILYLDRMITRQTNRDALMGAFFYALGALSTWYYAYMFAGAGLVYTLVRSRPWRRHLRRGRLGRCCLVFALTALLLVGPFALPLTQIWKEASRPQSMHYIDQFSASPLDFVYPSVMQPIWGRELLAHYAQDANERALYLGAAPLFLAIVALWRVRARAVKAYAWLGASFAAVALGTTLHLASSRIYVSTPQWIERLFTVGMGFLTSRLALYPASSFSLRMAGSIYIPLPTLLLYLFLPFFSAMRVWSRFGIITMFGVAVLAGYGFRHLDRAVTRRSLLAGALLIVIMVDFAAFPYALGSSSVEPRPVDAWLARQAGDWAVFEFPVIKAMTGHSLYMMRAHGKRIAFGYGTFFPRAFEAQRAVLEGFPGVESIKLLKSWDVRYVLVGSRYYGQDVWRQLESTLSSSSLLRYVQAFDDVPVYSGDRVLHLIPGTERAFIVDRVYVYEVR